MIDITNHTTVRRTYIRSDNGGKAFQFKAERTIVNTVPRPEIDLEYYDSHSTTIGGLAQNASINVRLDRRRCEALIEVLAAALKDMEA